MLDLEIDWLGPRGSEEELTSKTTQRWQPNSPLRSASNEADELLCSFDGGVWGSVGPAGLTPRQGGFRHVDKFLAMSSPTCAPKEGERGDDGVGKVCIDSGVFLAVIESRCYTRSLEGHAGFLKLPKAGSESGASGPCRGEL